MTHPVCRKATVAARVSEEKRVKVRRKKPKGKVDPAICGKINATPVAHWDQEGKSVSIIGYFSFIERGT